VLSVPEASDFSVEPLISLEGTSFGVLPYTVTYLTYSEYDATDSSRTLDQIFPSRPIAANGNKTTFHCYYIT